MSVNVITRISPNYNRRPDGMAVDTIVLHCTESDDTQADIRWLCTPKSPTHKDPSSAHNVIDRDGTKYELVPPERRAWHAGESSFMGRLNVNDFSIGIELANRGLGREAYPDVQLQSCAELVADYMRRFPRIDLTRITRHSDIALPLGRKRDPGPSFDVQRFLDLVSIELQIP